MSSRLIWNSIILFVKKAVAGFRTQTRKVANRWYVIEVFVLKTYYIIANADNWREFRSELFSANYKLNQSSNRWILLFQHPWKFFGNYIVLSGSAYRRFARELKNIGRRSSDYKKNRKYREQKWIVKKTRRESTRQIWLENETLRKSLFYVSAPDCGQIVASPTRERVPPNSLLI